MSNDLDDLSLLELFRMEAEEQVQVLQTELLLVEGDATDATRLESLMRAAHSLKGAARIVGLDAIVALTHAMEDRVVNAQAGQSLTSTDIDRLLAATDWLTKLQPVTEAELPDWLSTNTPAITALANSFAVADAAPPTAAEPSEAASTASEAVAVPEAPARTQVRRSAEQDEEQGEVFGRRNADRQRRDRNIRISAERFDQILSLGSEALVTARLFVEGGDALEETRRNMTRALRVLAEPASLPRERTAALREMERHVEMLSATIAELDQAARGNERTTSRLHRSILAGRLLPFSDGIGGMQRLVRDTARDLGKQVKLEVHGERTRVDRDILERLEAPLSHLVSNAIDHGIESQADRVAAGKPAEARIRLNAVHENGRLVITARDDGRGIDTADLRRKVVTRGFVTEETAAGLSDAELYEFLFLPGFSTRDVVSTVSGRGVGLNIVQAMVQEAGGSVTITSTRGEGTTFRLILPVTRSVIKTITVQAAGELFAMPLFRIDRVGQCEAKTGPDGSMTADLDGTTLRVVSLATLLGISAAPLPAGPVPVVISHGVAFAVDRFVDEVDLSVRRIDRRLGKIPGVSAAALDEQGLPILILDVDDLLQTAHGVTEVKHEAAHDTLVPHILVADDSHTVREMERRLLAAAGYQVTTAQNGLEAWNLLRLNEYDLLISDVDMPQMNGIELVTKVRENPRLAQLPVIILSYKAREEDRRRGLDAGADFYLTKGDFENDAFRQAVVDLIGEADLLTEGPGVDA